MSYPPSPLDEWALIAKITFIIEKWETGAIYLIVKSCTRKKCLSGLAYTYPYTAYRTHLPLQVRDFLNFLSKIF
jgi:hypothetical protein